MLSDRDTPRPADAKNSSVYSDLIIQNMDIGDILHKLGNYYLAIDNYTQALKCNSLSNGKNSPEKKAGIQPKDIVGQIFASICFMNIEDVDSSNESFLKSSIYISQLSVVVEKIKSVLQHQPYDYVQLLSYCDEFLEFCPFNVPVQLARKSFLALSTDIVALDINTDSTERRANIALRKRDNEKALELLSPIIEVEAVRDYYLGRSKALMQIGRLEEALKDCNMVSMLRGDQDWAVFKLRGQILMEMKKFKEAEEQFESLILQMNNEARESLLQSTPVENNVIVQQQTPIDETADIQRPDPDKPAIPTKKRIKLEPNVERLQSLRSYYKKRAANSMID